MDLSSLRPACGSTHHEKRIGRGQGSGKGGTSTRGHKGAKSRSGYHTKIGFEGGQMPLQRRMPKRGFDNSAFAKVYQIVNVCDLSSFAADSVITAQELFEKGLINDPNKAVKILGFGEIEVKLTVKADKFSKSAQEKIEAAGGKAEVK